ncbi:hypothetical protein L7E55_15390 [Pelotomaculum isophthalicicum JI]|uniref:Uncharacterized protein n=1 Tax=Pelotomaculum isophthalicicum JI TaxID=947010 RepID=A0A9X4JUR4_9FIRM|nr:hypothetical protein [Pelotomaculum isophthalicicum]MDF9409715.1 hypothetical protein [Pelotomaculum isophthalicicum JI]
MIWLVLGVGLGTLWIKFLAKIPFGGNGHFLGLDYPVMGMIAGQFAILMTLLFFNTFFDKWPLVRKEPVSVSQGNTIAK